VVLSWEAPGDGGSPIAEYVVRRGVFQDTLTEIARVTSLNHTDTDVENGKTYYYSVVAVNGVGLGEPSMPASARPLGPPGAPGVFTAKVTGNSIHLSWAAPTTGNTAEVTGYKVYRGTDENELELLAELGTLTSFGDKDVKKSRLYYYRVVATSEFGDSEMSRLGNAKIAKEEEPGFGTIAVVLAMGTVMVLTLLTGRRR
jgi:fibronectin type 3 domain-containing protein